MLRAMQLQATHLGACLHLHTANADVLSGLARSAHVQRGQHPHGLLAAGSTSTALQWPVCASTNLCDQRAAIMCCLVALEHLCSQSLVAQWHTDMLHCVMAQARSQLLRHSIMGIPRSYHAATMQMIHSQAKEAEGSEP